VCNQYGDRFCLNAEVTTHIEEQHEGKFACMACSERILSQSNFVTHLETHLDPGRPLSCMCAVCGLVLTTPREGKRHEERHFWVLDGDEACPKRNAADFSAELLAEHVKRCKGNKRAKLAHECDSCMEKFRKFSQLQKHTPICPEVG
jgi:hypothetical protein